MGYLQPDEDLAAPEDIAHEPAEEDDDEGKSEVTTLLTEKRDTDAAEKPSPEIGAGVTSADLYQLQRPDNALAEKIKEQRIGTKDTEETGRHSVMTAAVDELHQHTERQTGETAKYHNKCGRPDLLADGTNAAEQEAAKEEKGTDVKDIEH